MNAFFIAFWKGEERKIKSRENDMKIRRDFCIVFCICSRKECDNVQESDLQRASKILRTAFGSDWKQIVQTLGTRELALTWFHLLRMTLEQLNGHATLKQLYQELREHPKAKKNKNYEARIRATLYEHADCFLPLARGTFRLKYR